jgi:thioredoxin-related protein
VLLPELLEVRHGGQAGHAPGGPEENFKAWGSSTTPTMVLIDEGGVVRLYHPGKMTHEELIAALRD